MRSLKVNSKALHIPLVSVICSVSILMLGAALLINHGFFSLKALFGVVACIFICGMALVLPRTTLLLSFDCSRVLRRSFIVILAGYFAFGVMYLRHRHPFIDVVLLENDSEYALLHGSDPYGRDVTHADIYSTSRSDIYGPTATNGRVRLGFPYPPLTLFWTLPGYLLGDVRYSFLSAVVLTALIAYYNEPNLNGIVAAIFILSVPDTLFVLSCGWTEPLMVLTIAVTVLAAKRESPWLPVALGFFFASKQYSLLAVPLVSLLLSKFSWKLYLFLIAKAGAVATVINLPFLIWDPQGFWWSLVGFRLLLPLRLDALSFSALLGLHGLHPIPQWFVLLAVLAATVFAIVKAPRTPAGFALGLGLVSLIFFVFNIAAFCNYYFFCACVLCFALSSTPFESGETFFMLREVVPSELP